MERLSTDMHEACLYIDKDCRLVENDYLVNLLHGYYFFCIPRMTTVITRSDYLSYDMEVPL